ncbi:hypothetical protein [Nocardia sp. NPDC050793]|uniref:hypothetical protein n=1 Tax=Nocardia sp. NPDC050793 TaxID=3155159 RepID=UPI0033CCE1BB
MGNDPLVVVGGTVGGVLILCGFGGITVGMESHIALDLLAMSRCCNRNRLRHNGNQCPQHDGVPLRRPRRGVLSQVTNFPSFFLPIAQ